MAVETTDQSQTNAESAETKVEKRVAATAVANSTDLADPANTDLLKPKQMVVQDLPDLTLVADKVGFSTKGITDNPPPDGGAKGDVKKDEKGRVVEVDYPNGQKRSFGYDDEGKLNKVVQPDGTTYVMQDGKWLNERDQKRTKDGGEAGKTGHSFGSDTGGTSSSHGGGVEKPPDQGKPAPADFSNPEIGDDGTFRWETKKGREVVFNDGSSMSFGNDGSLVVRNNKDQVTGVSNEGGNSRTFGYDVNGNISTIKENGQTYTVRDGKIIGPDDKETGRTEPQVAHDGTYMYKDETGGQVGVRTDGTSETHKTDDSIVKKDAKGHVTEVDYPNGQKRSFQYNDDGDLTGFTDPDGKVYKATGGVKIPFINVTIGQRFESEDGDVRYGLGLKTDGTFQYVDKNGKVHADYTTGNFTTTTKTVAELQDAAQKVHDADANGTNLEDVRKTLAGMDTSDRVALEAAYRIKYGVSLSDQLTSDLNDPKKHDNAAGALTMLADAHLRDAALKKISNPAELQRTMTDIDDFQKRAIQQGVPPADIAAAEQKAADELIHNRKFPNDQISDLEKTLGQTAPSVESVGTKYGVKYDEETGSDGKKVRHYYIDGEQGKKLPVLDSNTDNPIELERQLQEWRDKKADEIEQKYNVRFSKDGTKDSPLGKEVDMRAPRIDELLALEYGFEHSQPSTSTVNGKPILVQFAVQPTSTADAYVIGNAPGGGQRIVFEPVNRDFSRTVDVILHEWAHNAEHNNDVRNPQVTKDFYAAQGYRSVDAKKPDGKDYEQWQMRDKDGNYWAQAPDSDPFSTWYRVDQQGRPLRADGTPATNWADPGAAHQNNDKMADTAAVRPASGYHPNPVENGAEAEAAFRHSAETRESLYKLSPDLYAAARKFDQDDLDNDPNYGRNEDGTSKYIRLPDGTVGLNNEQNQQKVADFEQLIKQPKSKPGSSGGGAPGRGSNPPMETPPERTKEQQ